MIDEGNIHVRPNHGNRSRSLYSLSRKRSTSAAVHVSRQLLAIPVRNDADLADLARDSLLVDVMDRLEAKGLKARRTGVYHFSTGADSNNQLTLIPSSDSSKQCSEVSCAVSGTKPRTSTADHRLLKRLVGSISGPETSSALRSLYREDPLSRNSDCVHVRLAVARETGREPMRWLGEPGSERACVLFRPTAYSSRRRGGVNGKWQASKTFASDPVLLS